MSEYKKQAIKGACIYGAGDLIASLMLSEASLIRALGMTLIGGTIYATEIPAYFHWIEKKTSDLHHIRKVATKTALALAYFNPLWIARHSVFILLLTSQWPLIQPEILLKACTTFLVALPVTIFANALIQTKVPLKQRFMASALFSCAMAIYYALMAQF